MLKHVSSQNAGTPFQRHSFKGNALRECGAIFQDIIHALNQKSPSSAMFLVRRIHGSWNNGVEAGVALHATIPNGPLGDFGLPVPTSPNSTVLEVLVPKGGSLLPGDTARVPLIISFICCQGTLDPLCPGIRGKESPPC